MKNTIYILFLVAFCSFGQDGPGDQTTSLIDVKNEIENNGGATTNSLVAAFANANSNGFDPNYVGNKDRLSNFILYQHSPPAVVSSFTMSLAGESTAADACTQSAGTTRWKTGSSGSAPGTEDVIYTSSAGTTRFNGGGLWFKATVGGFDYRFLVSSTGVITSSDFCP